MQEISRGIYYENAYSGVTLGALLLPHGTVFIDTPLRTEDVRAWRSTLLNMGGNSNRILVSLDAHPDRTLGARAMDCTIITHQKTAQTFRNRPSIFKGQNADSGSEWEAYDDAIGTRWALPDITFSDSVQLHWGPPTVILNHRTGPTQGTIWATVVEAKVVFVGDSVLSEQPPFLANADIPAWLETLEILLHDYRDFVIISGRGGPASLDNIKLMKRRLSKIMQGLDVVDKQEDPVQAIEGLIPSLLEDFNFPTEQEEIYVQRFRHGLAQYYMRRYHPTEIEEEG